MTDAGCEACPIGMTCAAGSSALTGGTLPVTKAGFMTLLSKPLKVYKCHDSDDCPGGPPGTCAPDRDSNSVGCSECAAGTYESSGLCKKCEGSGDLAPLVCYSIGGLLLLMLLALSAVSMRMHASPVVTAMNVASIFISALQVLGILAQIGLDWGDTFTIFDFLYKLLSFDIKVLRLSCIVSMDNVSAFAIRQLLGVVALLIVVATSCCKSWCRRVRIARPEIISAIGTFIMLVFTSLVLSAISPLICFRHPPFAASSSSSMVTLPGVLCDDGEQYRQLVILGILGFVCDAPLSDRAGPAGQNQIG